MRNASCFEIWVGPHVLTGAHSLVLSEMERIQVQFLYRFSSETLCSCSLRIVGTLQERKALWKLSRQSSMNRDDITISFLEIYFKSDRLRLFLPLPLLSFQYSINNAYFLSRPPPISLAGAATSGTQSPHPFPHAPVPRCRT